MPSNISSTNFSENRSTWDEYIALLSDEQFTQNESYSHGSVRNQIVHLISVDETWFSGLRGAEIPDALDPASFEDRNTIRKQWDAVEQRMRDYLADLRDDMLFEKPFADGEDKDLILWQVLLQVANHGHRPPRATAQAAERSGRQDCLAGLHLLRVRPSGRSAKGVSTPA